MRLGLQPVWRGSFCHGMRRWKTHRFHLLPYSKTTAEGLLSWEKGRHFQEAHPRKNVCKFFALVIWGIAQQEEAGRICLKYPKTWREEKIRPIEVVIRKPTSADMDPDWPTRSTLEVPSICLIPAAKKTVVFLTREALNLGLYVISHL